MTEKKAAGSSAVRMVEVTEDQHGQRVDNFLRTQLKGVPKSLIYRICRKGEIRVNKKRIKPDTKLQSGDIVRIPPVRVADRAEPAKASDGLLNKLEQSVLYEDKDLIIINKPSGLAVHGGSGVSLGLIESMRQLRPQQKFLELVHRLDRDTSGCIMIAKKRSMLKYLHECLRQKGRINKIYHALVAGRWPQRKQRVDAPLNKNELKSGERIVRVHPMGKESVTEFKVLRRFSKDATLIEARPLTGRTHQIRVHTQFAGHPIIGDEKYGTDDMNAAMRQFGFKRLFLHAAELRLKLPDGTPLQVKAPLDENLAAAMQRLGKNVADSFDSQEVIDG